MQCLNCKDEIDGNCEHITMFKLCCECYNVISEIIKLSYKNDEKFRFQFINALEKERDKLIEQSFKLYIQKNYPEVQ